MQGLLATLAARQDTAVKWLFVAAAVAILAAFLSYFLRERRISIEQTHRPAVLAPVPRPPVSAVVALVLIVLALALAWTFATNGTALRQFLTTAPGFGQNIIANLRPAQLPNLTPPPPPTDTPLRQSMAQIGCQLLLQEKRVAIAGMDTCISQLTQSPADVFKYITGESLGAPWDALSQSEKQMAVDKAKADANGPHQAAQQQAAAQKNEAEFEARLNAYNKCIADLAHKGNAYISQQCPSSTTDMMDYWNCSEKVQQSAYFKEHFDCKAPY